MKPPIISRSFQARATCVAVFVALASANRTAAQMTSGMMDFSAGDPGFTIQDGGAQNVVVSFDSPMTDPILPNVMQLTLTRDFAIERVYLDLPQNFDGNSNDFKLRVRFAVVGTLNGSSADVIAGFHSSEEFGVDNSTTGPVIEPPGTGNSAARWMGGAYERNSNDIAFNTWYIYDFEFQPDPEIATLQLYEDDAGGTILFDEILGGGTSGITRINQVGFGNEDRGQNDAQISVLVDWMTWAVNTDLPADPASSPTFVVIPPTEREWSVGSGDWTSDANWAPNAAPVGPAAIAVLTGEADNDPRTVFTDTDVTVAGIQFDSPTTYVAAGTGSFTLEADENASPLPPPSGTPEIKVMQGSHQFQAVVNLGENASADLAPGTALEFNNQLNLNGHDLTQTGSGTLQINNELNTDGGNLIVSGGTLGGGGVVNGDVDNGGGTVAPGNSPGVLTINGDYTQHADGALAIEIGGLSRGGQYDALVITGEAILDGTLEVLLLGDFTPSAGDAFDLLDFSSVSGEFETMRLPELAGALRWDTTDLLTTGVIVAIPEPAAWGLFVLAASGVVLLVRRKRAPATGIALLVALAVSATTDQRAFAISGTIDFGSDPGFTIQDDAGSNVLVNIRTADSVMDIVMTRDQSLERVYLPLPGIDVNDPLQGFGNNDIFRARLRFAVADQNGSGADVNAGFLSTHDTQVTTAVGGDSSTTAAVIEGIGTNNYPARLFGGSYDRLALDADFDTWYVYEFEFQADPETANLNWYEGDGSTLIDLRTGGATSGIDGLINAIGFGNEDAVQSSNSITAVIDFMTWSVNETLPADPTYACPNGSCIDATPVGERIWQIDAGGNWNANANWAPFPFAAPDGNTFTAVLGGAIGSSRTIYNNADVTVAGVEFANQFSYAVAGTGSLTFEAASGNPTVTVSQGFHEFQLGVSLAEDTVVDVAGSATLEFDNRFDLGGNTVTKTGAGTMSVNNVQNLGTGDVQVNEGTLGGSGRVGGSVTIASGGAAAPGNSAGNLTVGGSYTQEAGAILDIEIGGTLAGEDYDVLEVLGDASVNGTLSVSLIDGFVPDAADTFRVLTSSAELTDLGLVLGGPDAGMFNLDVDLANDLIMLTVGGFAADFDGDGDVDGDDFLLWQTGFPLANGAIKMDGDADNDGDVDGDDFLLWQTEFPSPGSGAGSSAVPEPSTVALALLGVLAISSSRVMRTRCRM